MRLFGKSGATDVDFVGLDDRLIVCDTSKKTVDIMNVDEVNDVSVMVQGHYVIPKEDCHVHTSPKGRVYIYQAPTEFILETERLARLEQSIVLSHITNYREPKVDNPNLDMKFWAIAALLFVAIIAAAF